MPEYLAPGVFVEEINSGSRPLEGVGTNTAAFIGYAKSGDFNKPIFITNWTQFCQTFGEEQNGYVRGLCTELDLTVEQILSAQKASRKGWPEFAQGAIRGALDAKRNGNGGTLTVSTYQEFLKKYGIPAASVPYIEGTYLAHAVWGYFQNGGGRAYIIRVARPEDIETLSQNYKNGQSKQVAGTSAKAAIAAEAESGPLAFKALTAGTAGNDIKVEAESAGEGGEFRLKVTGPGGASETFGHGKEKALTYASTAAAVNGKSKLVAVEVKEMPDFKFEPFTISLAKGADAIASVPAKAGETALAPAGLPSSLSTVQASDFLGDEARRTGMSGLSALDDVNMVLVPDLMAGAWQREKYTVGGQEMLGEEVLVLDEARKKAILDIQCNLVAYCERMADRMAILDPIPGLNPQEMKETCLNTPFGCDHGQAAIYYPWIKIVDPLHKGEQIFCPPCGHIAGVWARVGVERGIHKAPANESLRGAVALELDITKGEQEILNPDGVNCIRTFPGTGIRIWGARTLATIGNPSWKYVNVRRLFNYLEKSMERGLQWVVFEPNDVNLWGRVRRVLSAFLYVEWTEGKLFGETPDTAFYVKCDAETNSQETIDLGRMYVEIGVNPVKPAEFVIIRIGQWSGGGSIMEG